MSNVDINSPEAKDVISKMQKDIADGRPAITSIPSASSFRPRAGFNHDPATASNNKELDKFVNQNI